MRHSEIQDGGTVIEVCCVADRPLSLYVECRHYTKQISVGLLLSKTEVSDRIEVGDLIEWKSLSAYWTPAGVAERLVSSDVPAMKSLGMHEFLDYRILVPMHDLAGFEYPSRPNERGSGRAAPWAMLFRCNDEITGQFVGTVDSIEFGIVGKAINDSEHRLLLRGPDLSFSWTPSGFMLSAQVFRSKGLQVHACGWCYDGAFVCDTTAVKVMQLLRNRGWDWSEGSERLRVFWEKV